MTIDSLGLGTLWLVVSFALIVLIGTYLITSANAGTEPVKCATDQRHKPN